jgi:hypothetical protein
MWPTRPSPRSRTIAGDLSAIQTHRCSPNPLCAPEIPVFGIPHDLPSCERQGRLLDRVFGAGLARTSWKCRSLFRILFSSFVNKTFALQGLPSAVPAQLRKGGNHSEE